jgi:serine/threonine protein kinase
LFAEYDAVRRMARGERRDYRLERGPFDDQGGQGQVFLAVHKPSNVVVAIKKARRGHPDYKARMHREIAVARALESHPNVMPVLDASPADEWFVMPKADGNAEKYRASVSDGEGLRVMIEAVAEALDAAHKLSWVHRDVKPANILYFEDEERWVLADWGLGRGPRGQTSQPKRTKLGVPYGTEGFAAPELAVDAHSATPAADIYSLGQVIGWALTGSDPLANVPLLPPAPEWRGIVRPATRQAAAQRPQDIDAFRLLMTSMLDAPSGDPSDRGRALITRLRAGEDSALFELLELAERASEDGELYLDVLPTLTRQEVAQAAEVSATLLKEVASALRDHLETDWGRREFSWANSVIGFALHIAEAASRMKDFDLLDQACDTLFAWDDRWDQWNVQTAIRRWLRKVNNESAPVVAAHLRSYVDSARHMEELARDPGVPSSIRAAIRMHT